MRIWALIYTSIMFANLVVTPPFPPFPPLPPNPVTFLKYLLNGFLFWLQILWLFLKFILELVCKNFFSKVFSVSTVTEDSKQVVSGDSFLIFFIIVLFTILHLLIIIYYKIWYLHTFVYILLLTNRCQGA